MAEYRDFAYMDELNRPRGELNESDSYTEALYNAVTAMAETAQSAIQKSLLTVLAPIRKYKEAAALTVFMAQSIVSLVTTIAVFVKTKTTAWMKALLVANLVASLTTFSITLAQILCRMGFPWCHKKATTTAKDLAAGLATEVIGEIEAPLQPNASQGTWIKLGVTSTVAILFAGLGFTNTVSWKDLTNHSKSLESVRTTARTVNEVSDFVLREVIGIESDSDYIATQALEDLAKEGSAMQHHLPAHFIQDTEARAALYGFLEKCIKVTTMPLSKTMSQRYSTTKNLLTLIYKSLLDKKASVEAILQTKQRQATVGVVLSGVRAVGKSEFAKFAAKKIAEQLGYSPAMYSLNKRADGFFEPYGAQAFGICNEWMATRSEDPVLRDLNLICSSDPMNFEGAALDNKVAPCALKVAFFTANADNPDLTCALNEGAALAVWDRMLHFRVEDPLCRGRDHPNPHRKSDFSHLKFVHIKHTAVSSLEESPVSLARVLSKITGRMAYAEKSFLASCLDSPDLCAQGTARLRERMAHLDAVMLNNPPFDLQPNGWGREFFCIRIQGNPGTLKTTTAERIAIKMSHLFNMKIQLSRDLGEFHPDPDRPMIYCLDDYVDGCDHEVYVQKMNKTHPKSMFLLPTNTRFKRQRPGFSVKRWISKAIAWGIGDYEAMPYDCTGFKNHIGILRRSGIQGLYLTPDGTMNQNSEVYNMTFDTDNNSNLYDAYGRLMTHQSMMDVIFSSYRTFYQLPVDFMICRSMPNTIDKATVAITCNTYTSMISCLKSKAQILKAYTGIHPDVTFNIDYDAVKETSPQTTLESWIIPEQATESEDAMVSIFTRMCGTFGKLFPNGVLSIKVIDRDMVFYFTKGIGYIYNPNEEHKSIPFTVDQDSIVYYRSSEQVIRITCDEYIAYRFYRQFCGDLASISLIELSQLNRFVDSVVNDPHSTAIFKINYKKAEASYSASFTPEMKKLTKNFKDHPVFWIGCALLAGLCAGGFIYALVHLCYKIYQWMNPKKEEKITYYPTMDSKIEYSVTSNNLRTLAARNSPIRPPFGDDSELIPNSPPKAQNKGKHQAHKILRKLRAAMPNMKQKELQIIEKELDDYYSPSFDSEEDANFREAMDNFIFYIEHDTHPFGALCQAKSSLEDIAGYGETILGVVHANMLSHMDVVNPTPNLFENVNKALAKAYVVVETPLGFCYGIGLWGKYFLTVSHMIPDLQTQITIQSNGMKYASRCVLFDRKRDIAICQVTDKQFPNFPNTGRYFYNNSQLDKNVLGFYMRPGQTCQTISGWLTYHQSAIMPPTDNPFFDLSDQIWAMDCVGMSDIEDFVKRGDCGFPLLVKDASGQLKILGIHNSFATGGKLYFSTFSKDDHHDMLERAMRLTPNGNEDYMEMIECVDDFSGEWVVPKPYHSALLNITPDSKFGKYCDKLTLLGFSKELMLPTRPRNKHIFFDDEDMLTPLTTMPAATTLDYVREDWSNLDLATTEEGIPSPLFTQCLKYTPTVGYGSFDRDILQHAIALTKEDAVVRYSGCKILRLNAILNGIYDEPLRPVDVTTSAGPILKLLFGVTCKASLFDVVGDPATRRTIVFNDTQAAKLVRFHYQIYMHYLLEYGIPPLLFSKDNAKVELINAEKAYNGKVRLFNELDFSINMVLKAFFGDLVNHMMAVHETSPIKIGQDPYKSATHICKSFSEIEGNVISTDFSAFDKQLHPVLIQAFCDIAFECVDTKSHPPEVLRRAYSALARSLTTVVHMCQGTVYTVDRGNESGTFVTTALNSFSVQILTFYTIIRKWRECYGYSPTLKEVNSVHRMAILGDDRTLKIVKNFPLVQEDLVMDSLHFNLKCTPAKSKLKEGGDIDFCSRSLIWDEQNQIAWPVLKYESVVSMVRWYSKLTSDQIIQNLDGALFEAALDPDPETYNKIRHDARIVLRNVRMSEYDLHVTSRSHIRQRFIAYIFDTRDNACLSRQAERDSEASAGVSFIIRTRALEGRRTVPGYATDQQQQSETLQTAKEAIRKYYSSNKKLFMADKNDNPVSALYELLQACRISERPTESYDCVDGSSHQIALSFFGHNTTATSDTKRNAKRAAYLKLYNELAPDLESKASANSLERMDSSKGREKLYRNYFYDSLRFHLRAAFTVSKALGRPVIVLCKTRPNGRDEIIEKIRCTIDSDERVYVLSQAASGNNIPLLREIFLTQPCTTLDGDNILVGVNDITPNSGPVATQSTSIGDVMTNVGLTTIPQIPNVVPITGTQPAMNQNDPSVIGAFEPMVPIQDLNPSGPPNMLSAGAVTFDLKDLVYNQFIDCDKMFQFGDDQEPGKIIFQIPYDPLSDFCNPYIKQYVNMHERFAGNLQFRITVVGNQTFSGLVGISWQPRKVVGTDILISESMKFNYQGHNINQPLNGIHILHDARQDKFWRKVHDRDPKELDERPHLVGYITMTAVSPLKEGIKVRIRIASKLLPNFQVSLPIIPGKASGIGAEAQGVAALSLDRVVGAPVVPTLARPLYPEATAFRLVIDGNTYFKQPQFSTSDLCVSGFRFPPQIENSENERFRPPYSYQNKKFGGKGYTTCIDFSRATYGSVDFGGSVRTRTYSIYEMFKLLDSVDHTKTPMPDSIASSWKKDFADKWNYILTFNSLVDINVIDVNNKEWKIEAENIQYHLIMTIWGPILVFRYLWDSISSASALVFKEAGELIPITQVQSVLYREGAEAMPAGWRSVSITPDLPYVSVEALVGSTIPTHMSVRAMIEYFNLNIRPTEALQISLSDYESGKIITTLRYMQDRDKLIMNVEDDPIMFATSLRTCERMYISSIQVLPRSNAFPITQIWGNFAENQIHPDVKAKFFRPSVFPNRPSIIPRVMDNSTQTEML
jgi:hypothetical protein